MLAPSRAPEPEQSLNQSPPERSTTGKLKRALVPLSPPRRFEPFKTRQSQIGWPTRSTLATSGLAAISFGHRLLVLVSIAAIAVHRAFAAQASDCWHWHSECFPLS